MSKNIHANADEGISRRGFLAGAAMSAATAGMTMAGASGIASASESASDSAPATSPSSATDAATEEAKAAFEAEAQPITPVEPPAAWDYDVDVVVVGSGAGGFASAFRLAKAGYNVIMIEKETVTGGESRYSGFFVNCGGTKMAEEVKWAWPSYPYDPKGLAQYLNSMWQMTADPDLLYAQLVEGPKCIDWMGDELGVPWAPFSADFPAGVQSVYWEGQITKKNSIMINNYTFDTFTQMAPDLGVDIHLETTAEALVMDGVTVVGIKATDADGAEKYYHAGKGVVLTAGGFEMNRAMVKKYLASIADGIANVACPPYDTGEVIRMAQGAGADMCGFNSTASYDGGVWWKDYGEYDLFFEAHVNKDGNQAIRQPWLRINNRGDRVPYLGTMYQAYPYSPSGSEMVNGLTDQSAVEMTQPGGKTYVCFDSKYEELLNENFFGQGVCRVAKIIPEDDPLIDRVPEFQRDWRTGFQIMIDNGAVKKCDTIEELEAALGLKTGLLTAAVEKWNAACEAGEDWVTEYPYDPTWMIAISEPPYYGAAIGGHLFSTKCGVRINPNMQVINTDGDVIPGLYAGWHTAGGSVGECNIGGHPFGGPFGDVGISFVGGYMCAGAIIAADQA